LQGQLSSLACCLRLSWPSAARFQPAELALRDAGNYVHTGVSKGRACAATRQAGNQPAAVTKLCRDPACSKAEALLSRRQVIFKWRMSANGYFVIVCSNVSGALSCVVAHSPGPLPWKWVKYIK
jgi:hypothetical protein